MKFTFLVEWLSTNSLLKSLRMNNTQYRPGETVIVQSKNISPEKNFKDSKFTSGGKSFDCKKLSFLHLGLLPSFHNRDWFATMDLVWSNTVAIQAPDALDCCKYTKRTQNDHLEEVKPKLFPEPRANIIFDKTGGQRPTTLQTQVTTIN